MNRYHRNFQSRRAGGRRRGASVVEFALVAPVFLIFLFGMLEFGRLMNVQNVLTHATREGARVAVVNGTTFEDVERVVQQFAAAGSVHNVTVEVEPVDFHSAPSRTEITVIATVNFNDASILPAPWFLADRVIESHTVMRREANITIGN